MNEQAIWDVIIIGGGPAGLSAGIYTARDLKSTMILEGGLTGGMMALTSKVDNYPGYQLGSTGFEIAKNMTDQAKACGVKINYARAEAVRQIADGFEVTADGQDYKARTVLIATGTTYRKLGVPGEAEMIGSGVHFCATCDGAFYKDRPIAVIGGGNSAVEETLFLAKFASKIHLIALEDLTATEALKAELAELIKTGQVEVYTYAATKAIVSQDFRVSGVEIVQNGQTKQLAVDGVFIFIGLVPQLDFIDDLDLERDATGFIVADDNQTKIKGLFVAGDIVSGADRQIAVAVGDGVKAALKIAKTLSAWYNNWYGKTYRYRCQNLDA